MRKVAVFVNPLVYNPLVHGSQRQRAAVTAIAALLEREGDQVTITKLGAIDEAPGHARRAIASGCDTIFSCGGDGTVFGLLQAVAGSGVALGIIPMGTGNVLAQNLGLPRDPLAAARALLRSTPRPVPLGRVTTMAPSTGTESSWFFAMSAGMGAHALLMRRAERWGKHVSGRAAYYFAGVDLLLRHEIEGFEVEFTTTGGETLRQHASEALVVRVAELNRWRTGGDLERPLLRLAIVDAKTRLDLARASFGALAGSAEHSGPGNESGNGPGNRGGDVAPCDDQGRLPNHAVCYHDVSKVICRPIAGQYYRAPPLLQMDGEVLGASNAMITLAAEELILLWPDAVDEEPNQA